MYEYYDGTRCDSSDFLRYSIGVSPKTVIQDFYVIYLIHFMFSTIYMLCSYLFLNLSKGVVARKNTIRIVYVTINVVDSIIFVHYNETKR